MYLICCFVNFIIIYLLYLCKEGLSFTLLSKRLFTSPFPSIRGLGSSVWQIGFRLYREDPQEELQPNLSRSYRLSFYDCGNEKPPFTWRQTGGSSNLKIVLKSVCLPSYSIITNQESLSSLFEEFSAPILNAR